MESRVKAVSPTQENGLAVLSRLAVRPGVFGCLAPADPGEEELGAGCPITSLDWDDSDTALQSYVREVICRAVLPLVAGEGQVPIGGCEAGLVILDCDHRIQMRHLADAMLRRVGKVAEQHYRELPKHRRNERLSGGRGEQWKVVREALDRISLMQVFDQQQLQLALLSLPSLLQKQDTVSCIMVLGINMFYHQTRVVTPVSHRAHVARLVASAESATKEYGVRLLYTEHRLFGKEEDRGDLEQAVTVKKREEGEGYTVTLVDGQVFGGKLSQTGDWVWEEPSRKCT